MIKKILLTIIFVLNILNIANATLIEKYFDYEVNSSLTYLNLNGNIDNIINIVNGNLDNTNIRSGFKLFEVLGTTPAAGQQGRIIYNTTDNSLNFDTGSIWNKSPIYTGTAVQGDILYYGSGTSYALLTAGTKGQALTTGGASANPTYEGMTTQGDVEYHNGTNRTRLAAGTSGYLFKTQGSGANPTWTAPVGLFTNMQVFTSTNTWTRPTGVNTVWVKVWGAGGGGRGSGSAESGGGGGSGAYAEGIVTVTGNVTVTVGSGGAGGAVSTNGSAGGQSSFGTDVVAGGGGGGTANTGGTAGDATAGTLQIDGFAGWADTQVIGTLYWGGDGADAPFGVGIGGKGKLDSVGIAPKGYGAGGSGAGSSTSAGQAASVAVGGNGLAIVYWAQ